MFDLSSPIGPAVGDGTHRHAFQLAQRGFRNDGYAGAGFTQARLTIINAEPPLEDDE